MKAVSTANVVEEELRKTDLTSIGLNDRLTRSGSRIFMDGEPISPVLEREVISILDSKDPDTQKHWKAFALFIKDLYSNNTKYIREQLFDWLESNFESSSKGFTLLDDGRIVGYKGCANSDGIPMSEMSGLGLVKEKGQDSFTEINGFIPNKVGSVVMMPRTMVTNDPAQGCSKGLHIGTWDYAYSWGSGFVLTVAFSAADVVSVPIDCDYQKLRACKYEVLNITEQPSNDITLDYAGFDDEDEDDDDDDE
jgi:hypothetical protein